MTSRGLVGSRLVENHHPTVALLTTGGTIAAVGHDRLDLTRYGDTSVSVAGEDLVGGLPELSTLADVRVDQVLDVPSHELTFTDLVALADAAGACASQGSVDGIVVTHGTNTLEETAYFLDLTYDSPLPLVVTGAMRPASALSGDGSANLLDAVRVAIDRQAVGCGVLVTLNDFIHTAADVTKAASSGVGAFQSPRLGPVGRIHPSGAVELRGPVPRQSIAQPQQLGPIPRVDIVTSHIGADEVQVEAAVAAGAAGIVVAATGGGFLPRRQEEAIRCAAGSGVTVMVATRTGSGPVTRSGMGSLLGAGDLQPWKARILLSVALAAAWGPDRISDYLAG